MKKYFIYRENGQVCFISDSENKTELNQIQLIVSQKDMEKINQGYKMEIHDKKLILIKSLEAGKEERREALEKKIKELRGKEQEDEVLPLLEDIFNLIK